MGKYKGRFKFLNIPEADRREHVLKVFSAYIGRRVLIHLSNFTRVEGDIADAGHYTQTLVNSKTLKGGYWQQDSKPIAVYSKHILKIELINEQETSKKENPS